ncbi:MoaD/ThiS family protein [Chloroflexota bacterium]
MKVIINIAAWLKDDFGHKGSGSLALRETINPGTSIMDLVRILAAKYQTFGKKAFADPKQGFFDYCAVILNGKFISAPAELNTELKEGDTITLSPAFYGG